MCVSSHPKALTRPQVGALAAIVVLFGIVSLIGIRWGLPNRHIDKYLFGDDRPWSGEKILRLSGAAEKFSRTRGADVDADPLPSRPLDSPIRLTATEADVAEIYLRYRLYTHQPDEMITMKALAGMKPAELQFDPRLYQYGGLFIYPVAAAIRLCGLAGFINVRSDLAYYLDNPEEFGKFYVVARAYAAAWGIVGVLVVFAVARRLGNVPAGLLAALLFTLMPVVVCMAHEAKPHLPGAVLMLIAVWLATGQPGISARVSARSKAGRNWWLMCVCCGAALGTVLSSLPIFILIPLVAWLRWRSVAAAVRRTVYGLAIAVMVYLVTNPYIVINAVSNREVLRSNLGNSVAMYEASRVAEGFARVLTLTVEGATLPVLLLGLLAATVAIARRNRSIIPLAVIASVSFMQFVLIGAGKPGEYGRFGVFADTALAIGAACLLTAGWRRVHPVVPRLLSIAVAGWVALLGGLYLWNFHVDSTDDNSRTREAATLAALLQPSTSGPAALPVERIELVAEPAPYGCPPLNFSRTEVVLVPVRDEVLRSDLFDDETVIGVRAVDHAPRSIRWLRGRVGWGLRPRRNVVDRERSRGCGAGLAC